MSKRNAHQSLKEKRASTSVSSEWIHRERTILLNRKRVSKGMKERTIFFCRARKSLGTSLALQCCAVLNKINWLCLTRVAPNSLRLTNPCPSNSRSNWNLEMLIFEEGGKPENKEKNPRSRVENQQQTQPKYDAGSGNRTRVTLVGGERSPTAPPQLPIK